MVKCCIKGCKTDIYYGNYCKIHGRDTPFCKYGDCVERSIYKNGYCLWCKSKSKIGISKQCKTPCITVQKYE